MTSSAPAQLTPPRRRWRRLPVCAAFLVAIFLICLHPATSLFGGLVFWLLGPILPTAVNFLLAAWCATKISSILWLRCLIFVAISFVLAVNTHLPALLARTYYSPEVITDLHRPAILDDGERVDLWMRDRPPVISDPLSSPVAVGGDEGCMCMYFISNTSADYFLRVNDLINSRTGQTGIRATNYNYLPDSLVNGLHFDIRFQQSGTPQRIDLEVDVYDGAEKTASFLQRGIPYDPDLGHRIGRERRLLNGHFLQNSLSILFHDNAWTWVLRGPTSYVPSASLQQFLLQAVKKR